MPTKKTTKIVRVKPKAKVAAKLQTFQVTGQNTQSGTIAPNKPIVFAGNPFQRKSLFDYTNPLTTLKTANSNNPNLTRITGNDGKIQGSKTPYKAPMFFSVKNGKITPIKSSGSASTQNTQTRQVTIEGSMNLESYLKTILDVQNQVKGDFTTDGWDLVSFQMIRADGGDWSFTPLTFRMIANVQSQFSLSQIKAKAYSLLENYSTVGGARLSNVSLKAFDGQQDYVGTTKNDRNTPTTNNSGNSSGNDSGWKLPSFENPLNNLALGAGIGTPLVLGGLLILTVVILKR